MYEYIEKTKYGDIHYACADEGKKILIDENTLVDKIAMGVWTTLEDFTEVDDANYTPTEIPTEEQTLSQLKENQIKLSKQNLANYLYENPLFSNVKYEEGRYYNVTAEKQQQLTSKVILATMYQTIGIPYNLTWNDTGNECEPWELEVLQTLSMQIDAYVTPIIALQQRIEVQIKEAHTMAEVLAIDIEFTLERAEEWRVEYEQGH